MYWLAIANEVRTRIMAPDRNIFKNNHSKQKGYKKISGGKR